MYRIEINPQPLPDAQRVLALLEAAGTSFPSWTPDRMYRALRASGVVVCAWEGERLVGFARAISDFAWCAYLSQLAVAPEFQKRGIGRQLIAHLSEALGEEVSLLVHSAAPAIGFYESAGFELYTNVYRLKRKR